MVVRAMGSPQPVRPCPACQAATSSVQSSSASSLAIANSATAARQRAVVWSLGQAGAGPVGAGSQAKAVYRNESYLG
jgi:hypothetical protein